jgi:hypothetical protein
MLLSPYWEFILSVPNGSLELYAHILILYLDTVILSLTNVDGNFTMIKYHDG